MGHDSLLPVLLADNSKVLKRCLEELRPKLTDFRNYPGAQACFVWLLHHVQFPHLSGHLHEFLPFSLRFLDDWETHNKVVGVQCLTHLVDNVSPTEISWYGRTELIEEALDRNLVAHATADSLELVGQVCQCWFALLDKTEKAGVIFSATTFSFTT